MPELPEVEALAALLRDRLTGRRLTRAEVAAISVLKTYDPPVTAAVGLEVRTVRRSGKFLDLDLGDLHLVLHLARAGWLRLADTLPAAPARPGRGPLALRLGFDDGSGVELTEAGTQKRSAAYLVRDVSQVPGVSRLGPDPLDPAFDRATLAARLAGNRSHIKGVLRDQEVFAGIGNAYSDEILHVARLSPFKPAASLDEAEVDRLYTAIHTVLTDATDRALGAGTQLKAEKRAGMRVHGRGGEPCPVCGDTVRDVFYADSSLQYCPTCQTGGRVLADRRLSRLIR